MLSIEPASIAFVIPRAFTCNVSVSISIELSSTFTERVGVCASPEVTSIARPSPAVILCTKSPTVSVAKSTASLIHTLPLYLKKSPFCELVSVTSFISANVSSVATCAST